MLLVPPKDTVVKAGTTAMLHCSFLANPNNARIQWQGIDDNVLTASDKHSILDNGTLVIRDATDKDNGEYQCTVTNSRGNNTIMANLTVISELTNHHSSLLVIVQQYPSTCLCMHISTNSLCSKIYGHKTLQIVVKYIHTYVYVFHN